MASKRAILEHLSRPELQAIAEEAELEVRDRRVPAVPRLTHPAVPKLTHPPA